MLHSGPMSIPHARTVPHDMQTHSPSCSISFDFSQQGSMRALLYVNTTLFFENRFLLGLVCFVRKSKMASQTCGISWRLERIDHHEGLYDLYIEPEQNDRARMFGEDKVLKPEVRDVVDRKYRIIFACSNINYLRFIVWPRWSASENEYSFVAGEVESICQKLREWLTSN
jgi:hypothetical protein